MQLAIVRLTSRVVITVPMQCWGDWQVGVNDIELRGRVRANILLDLEGKPRIGGLQVNLFVVSAVVCN